MDQLNLILDYVRENKIVCPLPRPWNNLYSKIFDGFNEFEFEDKERHKYFPLILNGWGPSSKEDKHERFINSIEYFYKKYPDKRPLIEGFIYKNDDWLKWDD